MIGPGYRKGFLCKFTSERVGRKGEREEGGEGGRRREAKRKG